MLHLGHFHIQLVCKSLHEISFFFIQRCTIKIGHLFTENICIVMSIHSSIPSLSKPLILTRVTGVLELTWRNSLDRWPVDTQTNIHTQGRIQHLLQQLNMCFFGWQDDFKTPAGNTHTKAPGFKSPGKYCKDVNMVNMCFSPPKKANTNLPIWL